jgi:hypothetical protein
MTQPENIDFSDERIEALRRAYPLLDRGEIAVAIMRTGGCRKAIAEELRTAEQRKRRDMLRFVNGFS